MGNLYETDILAWASEQAELLRGGNWTALDVENIAEEIEDVGKSEVRELESRLGVLIGHLLKWKFQPLLRSESWRAAIVVQRRRVVSRLARTPSLKRFLTDQTWLDEVWDDALVLAAGETGLDLMATGLMWSIDDILDPDFLPDWQGNLHG